MKKDLRKYDKYGLGIFQVVAKLSDEGDAGERRSVKNFRANCKQCRGTGNPGKLHDRGQTYYRVCRCGAEALESHQRDIQEASPS